MATFGRLGEGVGYYYCVWEYHDICIDQRLGIRLATKRAVFSRSGQ